MVFSGPLQVHIDAARTCGEVTEVKWTAVPNYSISTLSKMYLNVFISLLREEITSIIIDIDLSPSPNTVGANEVRR